jgi:hypothetical protein
MRGIRRLRRHYHPMLGASPVVIYIGACYAVLPVEDLIAILGVPIEQVDDNRLYGSLDALLPHKPALEAFLKRRFGELFAIEYDLLLYDVTSTYFEGQANANPLAKRGYSRDHRPDCKQVCIGLVVTRCGLPLGYEVFAGNRHDSTTLQEIVATMEARYGTREGPELRTRCITQPSEHQQILLHHLGRTLPSRLRKTDLQWKNHPTAHYGARTYVDSWGSWASKLRPIICELRPKNESGGHSPPYVVTVRAGRHYFHTL